MGILSSNIYKDCSSVEFQEPMEIGEKMYSIDEILEKFL